MKDRPTFDMIVYVLMMLVFVFCLIICLAGWMQGNAYSGTLAMICALFIAVGTWRFISGDWP